ncbi:MAG: hypothetical protein D4R67_09565 [Bacteroidetes bacterium]|nr:MAG: hypothetical protein D4R67_09565 [Bacteroidota bacterium]
MRLNYILDKSFGPAGSFAGLVLVIVGLILLPFYWTGIILFVIGAFIGFTVSGCEIHPGKRLIRQYHLLFGLLKTGSWQSLDRFTCIRVVKTTRFYRTLSLSNRKSETSREDYRVVLEGGTPQSRVEVLKRKTHEEAIEEARRLSEIVKITMLDAGC